MERFEAAEVLVKVLEVTRASGNWPLAQSGQSDSHCQARLSCGGLTGQAGTVTEPRSPTRSQTQMKMMR